MANLVVVLGFTEHSQCTAARHFQQGCRTCWTRETLTHWNKKNTNFLLINYLKRHAPLRDRWKGRTCAAAWQPCPCCCWSPADGGSGPWHSRACCHERHKQDAHAPAWTRSYRYHDLDNTSFNISTQSAFNSCIKALKAVLLQKTSQSFDLTLVVLNWQKLRTDIFSLLCCENQKKFHSTQICSNRKAYFMFCLVYKLLTSQFLLKFPRYSRKNNHTFLNPFEGTSSGCWTAYQAMTHAKQLKDPQVEKRYNSTARCLE